jgi:hypothetical protein
MKKKRAAIIIDNLQLKKWQLDAIQAANKTIEIVLILNCQNTRFKKNYVKHFLYYILNFLSLKNHLTKNQKIIVGDTELINFDSCYEGKWQLFPSDFYEYLNSRKIDLVIKFGMGLLRLDEKKKSLQYFHITTVILRNIGADQLDFMKY